MTESECGVCLTSANFSFSLNGNYIKAVRIGAKTDYGLSVCVRENEIESESRLHEIYTSSIA